MSKILEDIFTHAIALDGNTRLKNEIHCDGKFVYIINYDRTVMLRFDSPKSFKEYVSFYASDYDSPNFRREGDMVVFERKSRRKNYIKKKSCKMPSENVLEIFNTFYDEENLPPLVADLTSEITEELDPVLGHIEFVSNGKKPRFLQKDLFAGATIEVDSVNVKGFSLLEDEVELGEFEPIAIRTNDFFALFTFCGRIKFRLSNEGYFIVEGDSFGMKGIIAGCIYDDVGKIKLLKEEGGIKENGRRKKPQKRGCVKDSGGASDESTRQTKVRRGRFLQSVEENSQE